MSKPVFEDILALHGRRNRSSYFWYLVCLAIFVIPLWTLPLTGKIPITTAYGLIALAITLLLYLAHFVVAAQRCRDIGWTGWAILLGFIPGLGWIISLALIFIPGTTGPNRYGPDPLDV
jgi:uncharacterized membrane protein YhaH (DUF805 family)